MSNTDIIVASGGTDAFISLTDTGKSRRTMALESAAEIGEVKSQMTRGSASDVLAEIHGLISSAEKCRVSVKKPYLDACKMIDAKHAEFEQGLGAEKVRIARLMADFDNDQRMLAEAEAAKARAEAARVENERQKALQDARNAATEEERAKKHAEAATLAVQATEAKAAVAVAVSAPKPAGAPSRAVWRFTVTDIRALYAAEPGLCEVTHSQSRINAAIAGGRREIAGLHIYQDTQISSRS